MFFDNAKYFDFVERCRANGITVPIIPGIKPLTSSKQLTALPKIFHVDLPEALIEAVEGCKSEKDVKAIGIEWCIQQSKELMSAGVPITNPVAGISIGLVFEGHDKWSLLTDIIGDEDHFGDMDFKIAGTGKGVTGIQLDLKIDGINEEIIRGTLAQAKAARLDLLRSMLSAISWCSKICFQSSRMRRGLPKVMALLQASEN